MDKARPSIFAPLSIELWYSSFCFVFGKTSVRDLIALNGKRTSCVVGRWWKASSSLPCRMERGRR